MEGGGSLQLPLAMQWTSTDYESDEEVHALMNDPVEYDEDYAIPLSDDEDIEGVPEANHQPLDKTPDVSNDNSEEEEQTSEDEEQTSLDEEQIFTC